MPVLELTQEELSIILECVVNKNKNEEARWKTLNSFLGRNRHSLESMEDHVKEHLQERKTYTDLISKINKAKIQSDSNRFTHWFK